MRYKIKAFSIVVIFSLLIFPLKSFTQVTKQQAIQKVINEIVVSDTGRIDVFVSESQLNLNDSIHLAFDTALISPYNYSWVFFVNDHPNAKWTHPCRYIFVDSLTGSFQVINEDQFPDSFRDATSSEFDVVLASPTFTPASFPKNQNLQASDPIPNDNLFAVLVVTEDAIKGPKPPFYPNRFWNDLSLVYNTLIGYGYPRDNIFVHYGDGTSPRSGNNLDDDLPGISEFNYDASESRIRETFENLSGESTSDNEIPILKPWDQLFVFMDGHADLGSNNSTFLHCKDLSPSPYDDKYYDFELATDIIGINCAQMIFLIQPCYSGGFATRLSDLNTYPEPSCTNRVIHTSTDSEHLSCSEKYLTDHYYTEFTFYWTAAVRGYYPAEYAPWDISDFAAGSYHFNGHPDEYHPGDTPPDLNEDGFIQLDEAFLYADNLDARSLAGYDYDDPLDHYDLEIPQNVNLIGNDDGESYNNLITLYGLAGLVENDDILLSGRNYMVGNKITVDEDESFQIFGDSKIYSTGSLSKILVQEDANMDISGNVKIYNSDIEILGDLFVADIVEFNSTKLQLLNSNSDYSFNISTFTNSEIVNKGRSLVFSNSTFDDCGVIYSYNGNINVNLSTFYKTWLYLENQNQSSLFTASVTNSEFETNFTQVAIDIRNYNDFYISFNDIDGYYNGIQLGYSGSGFPNTSMINNNEIFNCTMSGITIYNSAVNISSNHIYNNNDGIRLHNNSNSSIYGDALTSDYKHVNLIENNSSYELYASAGSFPFYFKYNAIFDEDNDGNPIDPHIYWDVPAGSTLSKDISYNCWDDNFDHIEDLYPSRFNTYPMWCPPNTNKKSAQSSYDDFNDALIHLEDQEYEEASVLLKSTIENSENKSHALASMKLLIEIEKFLDTDYVSLKNYYETNDSIQSDTVLSKLSSFLSNKCEIMLSNWQDAIYHYESIISNPETQEDSIYAIIDLGHTYLLMENDESRMSAQGKLQQHIPKSFDDFVAKRDKLLNLLPFKSNSSAPNQFQSNSEKQIILQNSPNPFSSITNVTYFLEYSNHVEFKVFDSKGSLVKTVNLNNQIEGKHNVVLDLQGMPKGLYYYSIYLNGARAESKKMILN